MRGGISWLWLASLRAWRQRNEPFTLKGRQNLLADRCVQNAAQMRSRFE